jgi:hypothetical protein
MPLVVFYPRYPIRNWPGHSSSSTDLAFAYGQDDGKPLSSLLLRMQRDSLRWSNERVQRQSIIDRNVIA